MTISPARSATNFPGWDDFLAQLRVVEAEADQTLLTSRPVHSNDSPGKEPDQDDWYEATYELFVQRAQQLNSEQDFFVVAAFAYSWAARIPAKDPRAAWSNLKDNLRELRDPDTGYPTTGNERRELLTLLLDSFTGEHGVVMASKILHFIAPTKVPMVDTRVARAWNATWGRFGTLPEPWTRLGENPGQVSPAQFVKYWGQLGRWCVTDTSTKPQRCYREMEKAIFSVGRKLASIAAATKAATELAGEQATSNLAAPDN